MRQANFEILRVVAMLMIVFWHFIQNVMMRTDAMEESSINSVVNYIILQYGMILCSVGVNLYVMITGFFLMDKSFKSNRFFRVWIQTTFYSFFIALLFYTIQPESVSIKDVLVGFIPIRSGAYWFVTDYLGLILIAPFLGKAAKALSHRQYIRLLVIIFLVGTNFIGGYPFGDSMGGNLGYSLFWFICLFLIGAYIRLHGDKLPSYNYLRLYILTGGGIFILFVVRQFIKSGFTFENLKYEDLHYNSFPAILAFLLFTWFKCKNFDKNTFTSFLVKIAPYTFGVYLIHNNRYISSFLWNTVSNNIQNSYYTILAVIVICVAIFILCIIIDYVRDTLFKISGTHNFILLLSNQLDNKLKKFV